MKCTRRRMSAALLACLLALSLTVPTAGAVDGVDKDHWAAIPLAWASEAGVLQGTPSGMDPEGTASRAMAVTVLYRGQGSPAAEGSTGFSDVNPAAYYGPAVAWATEQGMVSGRTETVFAPHDPVTRQEFLVMLYRWHVAEQGVPEALGRNSVATLESFQDTGSIPAYARDAMDWAVRDLLLTGQTRGGQAVLNPDGTLTRGEMAKMLYQYDCAVVGNPGKLYQLTADGVASLVIRRGDGGRFTVTDPAEIARFVQGLNDFTYTAQRVDRATGGWHRDFTLYDEAGTVLAHDTLTENGVRRSIPGGMQTIYSNESQPQYFAASWLDGFAPGQKD